MSPEEYSENCSSACSRPERVIDERFFTNRQLIERCWSFFKHEAATEKQGTSAQSIFMTTVRTLFWTLEKRMAQRWNESKVWAMSALFDILDELHYGRDTILLLCLMSPSSYILNFVSQGDGSITAESTFVTAGTGWTGPFYARQIDVEARLSAFTQEVLTQIKFINYDDFCIEHRAFSQARMFFTTFIQAPMSFKVLFWTFQDDEGVPVACVNKKHTSIRYQVLRLVRSVGKRKHCNDDFDAEMVYEERERSRQEGGLVFPLPRLTKKTSGLTKKQQTMFRMRRLRTRQREDQVLAATAALDKACRRQKEQTMASRSTSKKRHGDVKALDSDDAVREEPEHQDTA